MEEDQGQYHTEDQADQDFSDQDLIQDQVDLALEEQDQDFQSQDHIEDQVDQDLEDQSQVLDPGQEGSYEHLMLKLNADTQFSEMSLKLNKTLYFD